MQIKLSRHKTRKYASPLRCFNDSTSIMAHSRTPAEEFADLIRQYDDTTSDLKGYSFDDFAALEKGELLDAFLRTAQLRHQGAFKRIHEASRSLRLFELVFDSIPTGSSGVPHIHENLANFPMDQLKPLPPKESSTPLYRFFHQVGNEAEGKVHYSRQLQVQFHLVGVVQDVIRSCNYNLKPDTEAALNGLKVDVGIIRNRNDAICGTMEVKQPRRKNGCRN